MKKTRLCNLLDLFEGRGRRSREKRQFDLVYGALLDDWLMLVYVDVLFTCGECGISFLGTWSYSKE